MKPARLFCFRPALYVYRDMRRASLGVCLLTVPEIPAQPTWANPGPSTGRTMQTDMHQSRPAWPGPRLGCVLITNTTPRARPPPTTSEGKLVRERRTWEAQRLQVTSVAISLRIVARRGVWGRSTRYFYAFYEKRRRARIRLSRICGGLHRTDWRTAPSVQNSY